MSETEIVCTECGFVDLIADVGRAASQNWHSYECQSCEIQYERDQIAQHFGVFNLWKMDFMDASRTVAIIMSQ